MRAHTYLALGDSYTIGEGVLLHKSFPYQVVQSLRRLGLQITAPEIIAKTGWTTDELAAAMSEHAFMPGYDMVSLLIGVNNQYRGRAVEEYKLEFENLLKAAIKFASKKENVYILSIPDYSLTPFAASLEKDRIAREVDLFNSVNRALSLQYKVQYIDISPVMREAVSDITLVAPDGLHPSAKAYTQWAEKMATLVYETLR